MTTKLIGNIILFLTTIGADLGVLLYAGGRAWFRDRVGRHLMTYMASLGAVLTVVSIRNIIGPFLAYDELRLSAFALVGCAVWWRDVMIFRTLYAPKEPNPHEHAAVPDETDKPDPEAVTAAGVAPAQDEIP